MKIIKNCKIIEDAWQLLREPEEMLPPGDLIVPLDWWLDHSSSMVSRSGKTAVLLNGNNRLQQVEDLLPNMPLVALDFPQFTDGRCYSLARMLRERCNYKGEIRAVGDVLRDQLFFMQRCGIDAFALRDDRDLEDALAAFTEFSVLYQPAADGAPPIYRYR